MFYSTDPTAQTASPPIPDDDRELQVLSIVHEAQAPERTDETASAPTISQRSIAQALGMSVGLTNAILKRLTEKGFLMMRRINAHNVHYLVTPSGVDQISRRSYLYLRRTIGHVVRYKERLREFCHGQRERDVREIVLIGESDLAFILEWCAEKEGLGFRMVSVGEGVEHPGEGIGEGEPSGSGESLGSERGLIPDRVSDESPPAHAGIVYLLSELHPELASREGRVPETAIPLHEIVLGRR
jgi:DNA-binding MarR family transcriptional regulator